jgi:hypothetical protein
MCVRSIYSKISKYKLSQYWISFCVDKILYNMINICYWTIFFTKYLYLYVNKSGDFVVMHALWYLERNNPVFKELRILITNSMIHTYSLTCFLNMLSKLVVRLSCILRNMFYFCDWYFWHNIRDWSKNNIDRQQNWSNAR